VVPLAGHGEHALDQRAVRWLVEGRVLEERVNRGQPDVSGAGADTARLLQVVKECANQRGVQVIQRER
jgi:hypothetical protein